MIICNFNGVIKLSISIQKEISSAKIFNFKLVNAVQSFTLFINNSCPRNAACGTPALITFTADTIMDDMHGLSASSQN